MNRLLETLLLLSFLSFTKAQIWSVNLNDVFSINPEITWALAEGGTIYKTTNGGDFWETQYSPGFVLNRISFSNDSIGITCSNGMILRTSDGGENWIHQSFGTTKVFNNVSFLNKDTAFVVGDSGYILKTMDSGQNWVLVQSPAVTSLMNIHFKNDSIGIIVGGSLSPQVGTILRTTNGGISWYYVYNSDSSVKIFCISYLGQDKWISADNLGRIFKSTDDGITWARIYSPTGYPLIITDMHFFDESNGFLVGAQKLVHPSGRTGYLFRTSDGGISWIKISNSMSQINSISFTGTTGYIAGLEDPEWIPGPTLYKSINGGDSWFYVLLPVELISFTATAEKDKIILKWTTATELNNRGFEIERKKDKGQYITIGFIKGSGTVTEQRNYSLIDNDIDYGTYNYRLKQFDYDGQYQYSDEIEVIVNAPVSFSLGQNYPNPFNPSTTIEFSVPEKGYTSVKVYDIKGELICNLINDVLEKGDYTVKFDRRNLPGGIYFYELTSGNRRLTNKMCLIK